MTLSKKKWHGQHLDLVVILLHNKNPKKYLYPKNNPLQRQNKISYILIGQ
jgi:hypothetical protein